MERYSEEKIEAAKIVRATLIESKDPILISVYMAGEICMWDQFNQEGFIPMSFIKWYLPGEDVATRIKLDYEQSIKGRKDETNKIQSKKD